MQRDALERNSENMEKNDSAYGQDVYKTRSKQMYHISHRYIKREEGVKIGKTEDRITIGEEIDCSVEREITIVIEVMDEVEVILEEVVFEVEIEVIFREIIVGIETEKTGGLGDNQN